MVGTLWYLQLIEVPEMAIESNSDTDTSTDTNNGMG